MFGLYTTTDVLITSKIKSVIPAYDTIKVINRLLDGSFHVQVIGQGARIVNLATVSADDTAKDTIDVAESIATPVKVVKDSKYYIGIIQDAPKWTQRARGVYQTNLTLLASEEGAV